MYFINVLQISHKLKVFEMFGNEDVLYKVREKQGHNI